MANTVKKIQTVTVGSGGSSAINFTSIPQTYTDLKLVVSARGTANFAGSGYYYSIEVNGSSANLASKYLLSIGTSVSAGSYRPYGYMAASDNTASAFGNNEHYITDYASANNKIFSTDSVSETDAATVYGLVLDAGWFNSSAAITSIGLIPGGGNFAQYTTATLYGVSNVTAAENAYATGGIITYDDTYVYHTFPWSGTFTPTRSLNVDYLVVAGGGGAGGAQATDVGSGGGGGGGLRCTVGATGGGGSLESQLAVTAQAYTVTVGAGGAGGSNTSQGTDGSNSVFSTITSTGGGGGGRFGANGSTGGSGGGGGTASSSGGAGTANQGYAGGAGQTGGNRRAGGGGGAGAVGIDGTTSGNGGNGVTTSISGTSTTYAGGGGGGAGSAGSGGTGGTGGGANGSAYSGNGNSATANTGGGGGGASAPASARTGGTGGSGIVIVRYAR